MDLQEVGCGGMDWIDGSGYGPLAGICECGNEPSVSIKWGEFVDYLRVILKGSLKRTLRCVVSYLGSLLLV